MREYVFTFSDPDGNTVQIRRGAGSGGAHSVIPSLSAGRYFLPRLSFAELDYEFAALPELVIDRLLGQFEAAGIRNSGKSEIDSALVPLPLLSHAPVSHPHLKI